MEFKEYYRTFWEHREEDFRTEAGIEFYKSATERLYNNAGGPEASLSTLKQVSTIETLLETIANNPLDQTSKRFTKVKE